MSSIDDRLYCKDPSLARQAMADETDVNQILARYANGGVLNVNGKEPLYGDVSEVPDYATALRIVREADAAFATLPAKVRDRFNNDPGQLVDFVLDDSNRAEAVELGLLEASKVKPPATPEAPPKA